MYVIEFEKGVYSAPGKGNPSITNKIENARLYEYKKALKFIDKINKRLNNIYPNSKLLWI